MTQVTDKDVQGYLAGKAELKDLLALEPAYLADLKGRAQFFIDGGHHERALIMLEMLEELDRGDKLVTLLAIEMCLVLGRSDAAEARVQELLAKDPNDADALVAQAEVLIATGAMAPAAGLLERVLARDPEGTSQAAQRARGIASQAYERIEASR